MRNTIRPYVDGGEVFEMQNITGYLVSHSDYCSSAIESGRP